MEASSAESKREVQSTFWLEEHLAKVSAHPDDEEAWMIRVLSWRGDFLTLLRDFGPVGWFGRTCPESFPSTKEETLPPSSGRFLGSGMVSPGESLTLNTSEFHSHATACSLSDIYETGDVPQRYFLSVKACAGILRRAAKRNRTLPTRLRAALEEASKGAAGMDRMTSEGWKRTLLPTQSPAQARTRARISQRQRRRRRGINQGSHGATRVNGTRERGYKPRLTAEAVSRACSMNLSLGLAFQEDEKMAKPSLWSSPKFRRLCAMLKMPVPHVIGHLECLWWGAGQSGNPVIGNESDVELAAEWVGEKGILFAALRDCGVHGGVGFIEPYEDIEGAWQIHDFEEHAPMYVKERFKKREQRRAKKSRDCPHVVPGQSPDSPRDRPAPSFPFLSSPFLSSEKPPTPTGEVKAKENEEASLTSRQPPEFDDRVEPAWEKLVDVQQKAEPSKKPMKLNQRRRYALSAALDEHSEADIVEAWRWCLTATSERAANIRAKWSGIETLLNSPLKYIEQSQDSTGPPGSVNNFDLAIARMKQRDAEEEAKANGKR